MIWQIKIYMNYFRANQALSLSTLFSKPLKEKKKKKSGNHLAAVATLLIKSLQSVCSK